VKPLGPEEEVMRLFCVFMVAVGLATSAEATEKSVHLKQAPGLDKVESNCSGCHSLDYVPMNSPFLNAAAWDSEIAKMIHAFGAPISEADARTIANYLKENYGQITAGSSAPSAAARPLPTKRSDKSPFAQGDRPSGIGSLRQTRPAQKRTSPSESSSPETPWIER
jgi:mono/diheme cytochrome c family protein